MMSNCLLLATTLILAGLLVSLSDADVYLHNPRGSNNRLNGAAAARTNNNRMFDSQNNAKGGYNVGDKNQASNSEQTQFNMLYFQSGKGYASSSDLTGKSLLTIEWTNQHGCGDRDLNCNFVLQYRCQDDTKHQKLNHHTMRNGRQTSAPQYAKRTYTTRARKNYYLNYDSTSYYRGLHESWEWYDKCAKRNGNKDMGNNIRRYGKTSFVFFDNQSGRTAQLWWRYIYDPTKRKHKFIQLKAGANTTVTTYDHHQWTVTELKTGKLLMINNETAYLPKANTKEGRVTLIIKARQGLFTADQKLKGQTSIYTRQNSNGARSGYECPEERDYYPYWYPTDWIDIAVFAFNETMCQYHQRESFNVKSKEECLQYYNSKSDGFRHDSVYGNKIDCENNQGFWVSFSNYLEEYPKYQTEQECKAASSRQLRLIWAIPYRSEDIDNLKMAGENVESLKRCLVALDPPECTKAPYTRSNHLGNARGVVPLRYTWVIPHFPSGHAQRCVLRLRYNISTGDYPPFNTYNDAKSTIENNPTIGIGLVELPLQLAINTAQFGRTFQDRSHLFKLLPRPKSVSEYDVIYNLNVRGKRGNIVQAFPAVEYDFIPRRMNITSASLVHIQWTGSNTNPKGNDGQGSAGTDRHNMVEMADPSVNYPLTSGKPLTMFTNAEIVWSSDGKTKTKQDLILSMASSGYYNSMSLGKALKAQNKALNDLLNNAPASYRGMLLRFAPGEYYYMCTRNNNFSNRNQKGRLVVQDVPGSKLVKK